MYCYKKKKEIQTLVNHIGYQNIELGNIHIGLQQQNEKQAFLSGDIEFQCQQKVIIYMLKDLNMDKRKISKGSYICLQIGVIFYKEKYHKHGQEGIRYLNGEIKTISLHKRKLKENMNKILSIGVRYIYIQIKRYKLLIYMIRKQ